MTENMKYIVGLTTAIINTKYDTELPSLEQINNEAELMRISMAERYPVNDEEFAQIKKVLATNVLHTIGEAITLRGKDSEHQSWYRTQEHEDFYWQRYKKYLNKRKCGE